MNAPEIVLRGTVKPDGTLELTEKDDLHLPIGPVEVVIRPLPKSAAEASNWLEYLELARSELEAAGHRFRTKEEIDAEIEAIRADREDLDEEAGERGR